MIAAGTPPVRRTTFRYGGDVIPVDVKPGRRRRRPLRPAPHRPRSDPRRRRRRRRRRGALRHHRHRPRPGPRTTRSSAITAHAGGGDPFAVQARLVDRRRRHPLDGRRPRRRPRGARRHRRQRRHVRLLARPRARRLRVELPPRRRIRRDPDQRRRGQRVRRRRRRRGSAAAASRRVPPACSPSRRPSWPSASRRPSRCRPLRTFTGRPGHIRRSWGPGWALVGDAGYFKDPLSAHGITDALRDAELLARAAVEVVTGGVARAGRARRLPGPPRRAVAASCSTSSTPSPATAGPTPRSAACCSASTWRWPPSWRRSPRWESCRRRPGPRRSPGHYSPARGIVRFEAQRSSPSPEGRHPAGQRAPAARPARSGPPPVLRGPVRSPPGSDLDDHRHPRGPRRRDRRDRPPLRDLTAARGCRASPTARRARRSPSPRTGERPLSGAVSDAETVSRAGWRGAGLRHRAGCCCS